MIKNDLLSIVIPAYNLPDYTEKAIDSIISQTYRPIEIIISDDNSPNSLRGLVTQKQMACDEGIKIKFFEQQTNLGYYWNTEFVLSKAVGKYLVMLDHDDWLINKDYFSDVISIMNSKSCTVGIGNTFLEKSAYPMMNIHYEQWHIIPGGEYIKNGLFEDLHPSRSAVLMRLDLLKNLNYQNYFIKKEVAKKINIHPDEGFVTIALLLSQGSVALTGKVISVRGNPGSGFSSKQKWKRDSGYKSFIQHYELYKYFAKIGFSDGETAIRNCIIRVNPCEKINYQVIKHLNFDREAISLIFKSYITNKYSITKNIPRKIFTKVRSIFF